MNHIRKTIAPGIEFTYLPGQKFKTGMLSFQFALPLSMDSAAANALLPAVLFRGTEEFPTMGKLSAELDRLYGAHLDYTVRKKGEVQCVGFVARFLDDRFTLGNEALLSPMASLMGQLITAPVLEDGAFVPAYVDSEQKNLLDAIAGIINDKREYADMRLLQELCAGERYGISKFGTAELVRECNAQNLYTAYQNLLSTTTLEVIYSGSVPMEQVEAAVLSALQNLPRATATHTLTTTLHAPRAGVETVHEALDVTQGKLGMGFACTNNNDAALVLGNNLFGGSSNSKLFMNVREKLSLCYYASSAYHRDKGIITLSSGIEFDQYEAAYTEILAQLNAVAKGEIETWEWEGARSAIQTAYTAMEDSQSAMENYYLNQAITKRQETPTEMVAKIHAVTVDEMAAVMADVQLDTTYFLKGKDNA